MRPQLGAALAVCALAVCALLAAGCAGQRDNFYTLSTLPEGPRAASAAPTTHIVLDVSVPSPIDRREMQISISADRVSILNHELWAASLGDLIPQTLARDIERRRSDVIVDDRGFDRADREPVRIKVDVVQLSAQRHGSAVLEAHWRVVDEAANLDAVDGATFSAPLEGEEYAAVARSFSDCLSELAGRLAAMVPAAPDSGAPPPAPR